MLLYVHLQSRSLYRTSLASHENGDDSIGSRYLFTPRSADPITTKLRAVTITTLAYTSHSLDPLENPSSSL